MACRKCGEKRQRCIRAGLDICYNCSDYGTKIKSLIKECPICDAINMPSEFHHIAGRKVNSYFGVFICRNCHQILSYRQAKYWKSDTSNTIRILQGFYDYTYLMVHVKGWYSSHYTLLIYFEVVRHLIIAICEEQGFVLWQNE